MRFTHKRANTRAGTNTLPAIEFDGVGVFGDVLSFDGSIAFDGFSVVTVYLCDSIFEHFDLLSEAFKLIGLVCLSLKIAFLVD